MYQFKELQKYKICNFEGKERSGAVIALCTYVETQRVCFLLEGDKMGTWMPVSSLVGIKSESKETEEKVKIEQNAYQDAKVITLQKEASTTAWNNLVQWIDESLLNLNLSEVSKSVERLKESYHGRSKRELAQIVITHKSIQAAGLTALNIIPRAEDIFRGLFSLELSTVTKISAEMVYQIAEIYGYASELSRIQSDIWVSFGIALLGEKAIEIGISWLSYDRITSTAISAAAKALMIYAIGNAACVYYENYSQELSKLKDESQSYLIGKNNEEAIKDFINHEIEEAYTIDYTNLSKHLERKKWKKADKETGLIIQQITIRNEDWIDYNSILSVPTSELIAINNLWKQASNDKFGFLSQKKVYNQVNKDIGSFGERVGWRGQAGSFGGILGWKLYDLLTFKDSAPQGHLPAFWLKIVPGLTGGVKIDDSLKAILDRDDWLNS